MRHHLFLTDDGTLDTVFECYACGNEIRYSGEHFPRGEDGGLESQPDAYLEAWDDHCEDSPECENYRPETVGERGTW